MKKYRLRRIGVASNASAHRPALSDCIELVLGQVDAVMRNSARRHAFRMDATPPAAWGDRFSLRGQFRQPFLSKGAGQWAEWSGQLYAEFSRFADLL